jgi:hypothetical protein
MVTPTSSSPGHRRVPFRCCSGGNGTFRRAVQYGVDGGPAAAAIGDLNGDGHPDLVTANLGSADVSVLLGRGNGRFRRAVNYPLPGAGDSVAIADLDRDGRPDLAVATFGPASVLLNRGHARFGRARSYHAHRYPRLGRDRRSSG